MTNPKLRFIGKKNFSDDWLSITFSENFDFIAGKALSRAQLSEEGAVRNVHYGDILIKLPSVVDVSKDVLPYVDASVNVSKVPHLQSGDILFADAAEDLTAGKAVELKHCEGKPVIAGLHTIACRTKEVFASGFLGYYLNSPAFHRQLITLLVGTKVYSLSKNQLLKVSLSKPSIAEQQKIADFFTALDEKITLAERKLAALQTLKSGLMQKIFDGEIRFKREDGSTFPEWEKTRLDQLVQFQNGINTSRDNFGSGTKLISVLEVLSAKPITYETIRSSVVVDNVTATKFAVTYGDVLFQRSSETAEDAGMANVYLDQERSAVFGGFVIRGKKISEYNPIFLMEVLRSASVRRQMMKLAQGAQHVNIGQESLSQIVIELPSSEEQNKIAGIAATLSQKIDLVEQKLAAVKQQKQAFLQQMFI